jgi:hypothetical protein
MTNTITTRPPRLFDPDRDKSDRSVEKVAK